MHEAELSRTESLRVIFGSKHRLDIWGAILDYAIDPPELFIGLGVYMKLRSQEGNRIAQSLVWKEVQNLEVLGMIERVAPKHPAIYYQRLDSPGWQIATAALQVVTAWFPESIEAK